MARAQPPVDLTPDLWMIKLILGAIDPSYDTKDEKQNMAPGAMPPGGGYGGPPQHTGYGQQQGGYGGPGGPGGYSQGPPGGQYGHPPPGQYGQPPPQGYGALQGGGYPGQQGGYAPPPPRRY